MKLFSDDSPNFDVYSTFRPVLACLIYAGFFLKVSDKNAAGSNGFLLYLRKGFRIGYMTLMWTWVIMMTSNIFWMALVVTTASGTDPTNGQRSNAIITFLEESPYSMLAVRNAAVLTIFVWNSHNFCKAAAVCENLRQKLIEDGASPAFLSVLGRRPLYYVITSIVVIVLWEVYEWSVWFNIPALGLYYQWDMAPFPFFLPHYYYGLLWWLFISLPFVFSQIALCIPTIFALIMTQFCRYLNGELARIDAPLYRCSTVGQPENEHCHHHPSRIRALRKIHFEIVRSTRVVDKAVRTMLLVQFVFDMVVLFGFLGLVIESKYCTPRKPTLEWTFYIPTSMIWIFFLVHYNIPLIRMTAEGEKTHVLLHEAMFMEDNVDDENVGEFAIFMEESLRKIIGFTGRKFYFLNRSYLVGCTAVTVSYFSVLSEVLDRFYGMEELKTQLNEIMSFYHVNATVPPPR